MKVAVYGVWHVHASDYTKSAVQHAEVVGVYDANEKSRKEFCERFNVPEFTSEEALLNSDAEGVIVCTSTDIHTDVIIKIANAKKHIFTEKVLALTDEECDRIEAAVEQNGVKFMISMPHKSGAAQRTVANVAKSGELGKINYLRYRNCHGGSIDNWLPPHFYNEKECGGGAMIDLGAHGMYLTHWILGMPDKFTSMFGCACSKPDTVALNADKVEDNAVTVMSYDNGCIAINETGFVSGADPVIFEVSGEAGYVHMENSKVVKCTRAGGGKPVEVPLEAALPLPIEQFVTGGNCEGCGIKEAKALTHMMVMAYKNKA